MLEARTRTRTQVKVELFATNLHAPSHMEWTPEGRLLVSEHTSGYVKDITDGGDMRDVEPFAFGLQGPSSILPLEDGRILVAEMWAGRVSDIGGGGNVADREPVADGLKGAYSLARSNGSVYATERRTPSISQVTEIINTEGRSPYRPHVTNIPSAVMPGLEGLTPLELWPDEWLNVLAGCSPWIEPDGPYGEIVLSVSPLGQLVRVPKEGGDCLSLTEEGHVLATGLGWMGGMKTHPDGDHIYVSQPQKGTVVAVDRSGPHDYRFQPPVVQGLNMPTCVRFSPDGETMFVCSMPIGGVWRVTNFL